jgi:hypothetical protein
MRRLHSYRLRSVRISVRRNNDSAGVEGTGMALSLMGVQRDWGRGADPLAHSGMLAGKRWLSIRPRGTHRLFLRTTCFYGLPVSTHHSFLPLVSGALPN